MALILIFKSIRCLSFRRVFFRSDHVTCQIWQSLKSLGLTFYVTNLCKKSIREWSGFQNMTETFPSNTLVVKSHPLNFGLGKLNASAAAIKAFSSFPFQLSYTVTKLMNRDKTLDSSKTLHIHFNAKTTIRRIYNN